MDPDHAQEWLVGIGKDSGALLASQINRQPYRGGPFHSTGALILLKKRSRCLEFCKMLATGMKTNQVAGEGTLTKWLLRR